MQYNSVILVRFAFSTLNRKGDKNILKKILNNCAKPEGIWGEIIVNFMNKGHKPMAKWGISHLKFKSDDIILDAGCGGGANISVFLDICPHGKIYGIDYSQISVKKAKEINREAIIARRCEIIEGNVLILPYEDNFFDKVTAFETVYFWPEIEKTFRGIYKVIKPDGTFLVCLEAEKEAAQKWAKRIDGMNAYSHEEIERLMTRVGFRNVCTYLNNNWGCTWCCIVGTK